MNHSKSQNPWIPGLSSFAIHLSLLLLLAVMSLSGSGTGSGKRLSIDSSSTDSGDELETGELDTFTIESEMGGDPDPSSLTSEQIGSEVLNTEIEPNLETVPGQSVQIAETLSEMLRHSGGESQGTKPSFLSSSIEGRSVKNRAAMGQANGATAASEAAVEAALAYLARHQRSNGSWTVRFEDSPCQGECDHGAQAKDPHEIAATGLALLCFLGAGHSMHEGEYSDNVSRGVYFLIQNLKPSQSGRRTWLSSLHSAEMYEHGIATLALCEALQMKGDAELLTKPCQETINFIVYAQHKRGGWDYHPNGKAGDLSIVGWQVMALKSAVSAKLLVNAATIRGVDAFLNEHVQGGFMFIYNQGEKPTDSMTAIGTLMRIFRGWSKTDPAIIKAIEFLGKKGPSIVDLYYDYYATQAMFQYGGQPWKTWNIKMREHLINSQEKEGHMAGSWWFPGEPFKASSIANHTGGRFYLTTMACLTLEVYYRYLPVYDAVTEDFQF